MAKLRLQGGLELNRLWQALRDAVNSKLEHDNDWTITVRPLTIGDDEQFTTDVETPSDWRVRCRHGEIEILIPATFDIAEEDLTMMPHMVCELVWSIVSPDFGCEDGKLEA